LLEETGRCSSDWTEFGKYTLNGNQGCGDSYLFIARDIKKSSIKSSVGQHDLEEQEIEILSREEIRSALNNNHFHVASHALAACLTLF